MSEARDGGIDDGYWDFTRIFKIVVIFVLGYIIGRFT